MVVYYGFNNSNDSGALNDLSCHDNRLMVIYDGLNNSNDNDALNDLSCHHNWLMVVYDGFNSKDSDALNVMTTIYGIWWF